jgi:hypothetical protein
MTVNTSYRRGTFLSILRIILMIKKTVEYSTSSRRSLAVLDLFQNERKMITGRRLANVSK